MVMLTILQRSYSSRVWSYAHGASNSNINPAYQPHELEYCLKKIGVKAIVSASNFKSTDYYQHLLKVCPELGQVKGAEPIQSKKLELGTTGNAKAVVLSHNSTLNNAYFIGLRAGLNEMDSIINCPPPLFHCLGCVGASLAGVVHHNTVVLPKAGFDALASIKAVHDERFECTHLYGTPTMFIDMLSQPRFGEFDYSSLVSGVMAGSPCPPELCKQLMEKMHMHDFVIAYGSTETSPVSFITHRSEPPEERVRSIGSVLDHVEGKIVDGEEKMVRIGEKGELYTRGYNNMLEYWDDEEKTKKAIGKDQWYRTGDLAVMQANGNVMIVGRSKDMVIRGGENIYPVEIEKFLHTHPAIQETQVFGVPDKRMGEEVCAWIILKSGQSLSAEDVKSFCKGELSHYKIPRYILFKESDDFPRTVSGKIQKYKLQELTVKELQLGS